MWLHNNVFNFKVIIDFVVFVFDLKNKKMDT